MHCAPTRIRTWDHLLKREPLYQLSYGRTVDAFSMNELSADKQREPLYLRRLAGELWALVRR